VVVAVLAIARYRAAMREPQPDFVGIFLPAARAVAAGHSPYLVDGYFYTPWVAVLLAPVAHAPWVAQAWTIVRLVAATAACLVGALAFTPGRAAWIRAGVFAFAGVTVFYSVPMSLELWAGQPNMFVLLSLVCAAAAAIRGRGVATGVWLGVVAAVKSWSALILVWLLRRDAPLRSRSWLGVAIVGAATVGLAMLLGGVPAVWAMLTGPLRGADQPLLAANSVWGVGRMLFSSTPVGAPVVVSPVLQASLTGVALAGVLALLAVSLWWPGPAAIALFDVVLLVLLLLPVSHYYYLLLALPALWWWFAEAIRAPRRVASWVALAVLATWWVIVFRIAPEGGGFTSTTWPSLLRIFSFTLIAAGVSVIAAARLHRAERSPRAARLEMGAPA
jgi:hypothetical protein